MNYFAKQYNRAIFRMLLTENVIFKQANSVVLKRVFSIYLAVRLI